MENSIGFVEIIGNYLPKTEAFYLFQMERSVFILFDSIRFDLFYVKLILAVIYLLCHTFTTSWSLGLKIYYKNPQNNCQISLKRTAA